MYVLYVCMSMCECNYFILKLSLPLGYVSCRHYIVVFLFYLVLVKKNCFLSHLFDVILH